VRARLIGAARHRLRRTQSHRACPSGPRVPALQECSFCAGQRDARAACRPGRGAPRRGGWGALTYVRTSTGPARTSKSERRRQGSRGLAEGACPSRTGSPGLAGRVTAHPRPVAENSSPDAGAQRRNLGNPRHSAQPPRIPLRCIRATLFAAKWSGGA
jgi:hypothetical protein